MKKVIVRIILLFLFGHTSIISFSQKDSVAMYFDENAGLCTKEKAVYIAKGGWNNYGLALSFFEIKTGIRIMESTYTDTTLSEKNGPFVLYEDNGIFMIRRGNFINDKEDGYWEEWKAGLITDSVLFDNGKDLVRIGYNYHKNRKLEGRTFNDSRTKTTEISLYDSSGNILRYTKFVNGTGDQIYYYLTGQIKMIQRYKNKKIDDTQYFNPEGIQISEKEYRKKEEVFANSIRKFMEPNGQNLIVPSQTPEYPGGQAGFMSFFRRNFKVPESLGRDGFSESVTVTFYLDKSGFAYNIRVSGASNRDIETEVLTVFRRMAAWNMNGHKSFGPITYTIGL